MDPIGSFVNGMAFALGTVIITTIAIWIGFRRSSKFIEKIIAQIAAAWMKVKEGKVEFDGLSIDAKVKTKKKGKNAK